MSEPKEHTDALFKGAPPLFPASLKELNRVYSNLTDEQESRLERAAERTVGGNRYKYIGQREDFKTSDGYTWDAYEFDGDGAKLIIAFPDQKDITPRSVAFYVVEGLGEEHTPHILVSLFTQSLESLRM